MNHFIVTQIIHLEKRTDGGQNPNGSTIVQLVIRQVTAGSPADAITQFIDNTSAIIQDPNTISFADPEVYTLDSIPSIK